MQTPEKPFPAKSQGWKASRDGSLMPVFESRLSFPVEALRTAQERATAGQLALEMMHEITNPLEALGHLTYLAFDEADDPEKVRAYLRLAEEQMATLRHITNQTLGFARTSYSAKPIELAVLVDAALRIHQRTIESKKVLLLKAFHKGVVAEVHTGEMLQVISNLIANALDALPVEGTLCLRLGKSQGKVHLVVADNGYGIPAENVMRIFQPFFTTKGERGTGLGLALSKTIIERHQGRICIRSSVQPSRSGTIFRISLPG